ncbi:unnamed protein product, partial [Protopolystoma xenopodis]
SRENVQDHKSGFAIPGVDSTPVSKTDETDEAWSTISLRLPEAIRRLLVSAKRLAASCYPTPSSQSPYSLISEDATGVSNQTVNSPWQKPESQQCSLMPDPKLRQSIVQEVQSESDKKADIIEKTTSIENSAYKDDSEILASAGPVLMAETSPGSASLSRVRTEFHSQLKLDSFGLPGYSLFNVRAVMGPVSPQAVS